MSAQGKNTSSIKAIDVHCHVISPDREKYPLNPIGGEQSDWSSKRHTTPEMLLAAMDEAGVAKAAIVQASTAYGHDSSYLVDSVARFPERFTGVFSIDPLAEDALAQVDHWTTRGMTGMRVFTTGTTMPGQQTWLDDERAFKVWEVAGKRRLPVAVQMTQKGIPLLRTIVQKFPETNFLLDHLARINLADGPPYADSSELFALSAYPNVYMKFTSRTVEQCHSGRADAASFMTRLLAEFGSNRVLWGSNFPAHAGKLVDILSEAMGVIGHAPPEDQANILHRTAEKLYPSLA